MNSIPTIYPENDHWRFEYKYYLSPQQLIRVRNAIVPFVKKDSFTKAAPGQRYLVRSLYFDSHNYQSYNEKIDGNCDRLKLRIRTYSQTFETNSVMRAEIKVRKGPTTEKYSTFINAENYQSFINYHHWHEKDDPVLEEFERYFYLQNVQPLLLVQYYREGFRSRGEDDIRITFDHQVQSTHASNLFPQSAIFREHHRHTIVLEIKCVKNQPLWLRNLVQDYGLRIISSSKFAKGIEISRPDIVTPSWSN